jgi:hypothetical protein
MSTSTGDICPWHNPAAWFGNYGVVIKKGEQLAEGAPPQAEDAHANDFTTDNPYLPVNAYFHNSALARRCYFKPKDIPNVPIIPVGISDAEKVKLKPAVRAAKFDLRCTQLANAFTHVMNFTDAIGAILANAIFKLEPTRALGTAALILPLPLAVAARVTTFAIGAVVLCPTLAVVEGLSLSAFGIWKLVVKPLSIAIGSLSCRVAIKVGVTLGHVSVKVGSVALNVIVNLPSVSWKGIKILGFAVKETIKSLACIAIVIALFAIALPIDVMKFVGGLLWSGICAIGAALSNRTNTNLELLFARGNMTQLREIAALIRDEINTYKEPLNRRLSLLQQVLASQGQFTSPALEAIEKEIAILNSVSSTITSEEQDRIKALTLSDAQRLQQDLAARNTFMRVVRWTSFYKFGSELHNHGLYQGVWNIFSNAFSSTEQAEVRAVLEMPSTEAIRERIESLVTERRAAAAAAVVSAAPRATERTSLLSAQRQPKSAGVGPAHRVAAPLRAAATPALPSPLPRPAESEEDDRWDDAVGPDEESSIPDPFLADLVGSLLPPQPEPGKRFDPQTGTPVGLIASA